MVNANSSDAPQPRVLWDVVEEHLDEAAFGLQQLDAMHEHPWLTLADLAKYPEARLLAHIDALVVGGDAVAERVLVPALEQPDPAEPSRVTAAALAMLSAGKHREIAPALFHADPVVASAAVRAAGLVHSPKLEAWARDQLQVEQPAHAIAALLELFAVLQATPPSLLGWLQSDDPRLLQAAARAARGADPRVHLPVIEHLAAHSDHAVSEAALLTALIWGSGHAFKLCQRRAFDRQRPQRLMLALCAALDAPAQHERMLELLASPPHRADVLFALGFSGNAAIVPRLLEELAAKDELEAKLALQSIALITDLDLRDDAFAQSQAPAAEAEPARDQAQERAALPPLDADDLDADLAPAPEDVLSPPNAAAVRKYCEQHAARWDARRRQLAGHPWSSASIMHQLEHGPLRPRRVLALALAIRTRGQLCVDTRAWSTVQRSALAAARAAQPHLPPSPFSMY